MFYSEHHTLAAWRIEVIKDMVKFWKISLKCSLLYLVLILENVSEALRYSQGTGDENCETIKSEIHLIKEEFDELGRMQRTCNADVIVNKCEGLCNSQVQPSVITPTGFLKVSKQLKFLYLSHISHIQHNCH